MKKKITSAILITAITLTLMSCGGGNGVSVSKEIESFESDVSESILNTVSETTDLSGRVEKNNFDPSTNNNVVFRGFVFSVPSYWSEGDSDLSSKTFYAEKGNGTVMLQFNSESSPVDSYDELYSQKDDFSDSYGESFDSFEHEDFSQINVSDTYGLTYNFDASVSNINCQGRLVIFLDEIHNNIILITMMQSEFSQYSYFEDFDKIVNSMVVYERELETNIDSDADIPSEYKSALKKATSYSDTMHMSKAGIYDQLTSEYGEKFSEEAAQYAIDNMVADWNANALASAKNYSDSMHMSKAGIYDQLTSEYGEKFTAEEAQYAVDNLEADYKANALATAKNYQDSMDMSPAAIYDQLISEYGEKFTEEEAQYAIDNLE